MRMDHDFSIDQFIAEAAAFRWVDRIAAGVRVSMHKAGTQYAHVRLVHAHDEAMGLEPDLRVDPLGTTCVKDSREDRRWRRLGAKRDGADAKQQKGSARAESNSPGALAVVGTDRRGINRTGKGIGQCIHGCISQSARDYSIPDSHALRSVPHERD